MVPVARNKTNGRYDLQFTALLCSAAAGCPRRPNAPRDFAALRYIFRRDPTRPGAFAEARVNRNGEALPRPRAFASEINYYCAFIRRGLPLLLLWRDWPGLHVNRLSNRSPATCHFA